jgi:polysaccharide biosynthesis transport protein
MKLPQTTVLGLALLTGGLGLSLLLFPAQYEATEKIRINPFNGSMLEPPTTLDSYFLHATFEIINSEAVLGEVVTNLDLNETWGKKHNSGKPLSTVTAIERMQTALRLAPIYNTRLFTISYVSSDPDAAARIARAIADSYQDYINGFWRTMSKQGLDALQEEYQSEERQIQAAQAKVDELRRLAGIPAAPQVSTRWENDKVYNEGESQLAALKTYTIRQLRDVLPGVVSDQSLNSLLEKLHETERSYVALTNAYSVNNTNAIAAKMQFDQINRQIDDCVAYVLNAFEEQLKKEHVKIEAKEAFANEVSALDELLPQHRLLYLKIDALKVDAGIPKNAMVQIMDPAVPPFFPLPRNFGFGASLLAVGFFPTLGGLLLLKSSSRQITKSREVEK